MTDREPILIARSALTGIAVSGRHGRQTGAAGVILREVAGFGAAVVRARKGRIDATLAALATFAASQVVDGPRRTANGPLGFSGVAPGQWLVTDCSVRAPTLAARLAQAVAADAAVADQGDGRMMLEISGPSVRNALAKGVPIDLDPRAFRVGDVAQTLAAHIGLQIALTNERPTFELITAASTAGSFWSWFAASAAEYGLEVVRSPLVS